MPSMLSVIGLALHIHNWLIVGNLHEFSNIMAFELLIPFVHADDDIPCTCCSAYLLS